MILCRGHSQFVGVRCCADALPGCSEAPTLEPTPRPTHVPTSLPTPEPTHHIISCSVSTCDELGWSDEKGATNDYGIFDPDLHFGRTEVPSLLGSTLSLALSHFTKSLFLSIETTDSFPPLQ